MCSMFYTAVEAVYMNLCKDVYAERCVVETSVTQLLSRKRLTPYSTAQHKFRVGALIANAPAFGGVAARLIRLWQLRSLI